ncbi:MAG: hypothetical protein L6R41_004375 [Letrouitia leprolyta]|nr:MAG: hypothetical protein L6R41_004375 [Letrouitia leprolyta]
MGISRISRNEWIQVDQNYLERINYRRILLKNEQRYCIGSIPASRPAIEELYEEVMINHLPKRFPNMFSIEDNIFTNHVTRCRYLIDVSALTEAYMLNVLAENVEEDFYFMCSDGNGEYRLQAFSSCFPQGLLSSSKLGLSVREIHKPVPGYESRLGNGVDRYFRRMEPEMFFGRLNEKTIFGLSFCLFADISSNFKQWSIQTDGAELFRPMAKNTCDPDLPLPPQGTASNSEIIDIEKTYLRCEHHTLTCLPKTKTVMFCVRTYLTPISQIREEGSGHALADTCDSMPEKFGMYKRRPVWGDQLCGWLREGG